MVKWVCRAANVSAVLLFYGLMLLAALPKLHGVRALYGIPLNPSGSMDLLLFGKWLFMRSVPVLANGTFLERAGYIRTFSLLRMRRRRDLIWRLWFGCGFLEILWALLLSAGGFFLDGVRGAAAFPLLALSGVLWGTVQLALYERFRRAAWTGLLLLGFAGGVCLAGLQNPALAGFMPAMWGMPCRAQESGAYVLSLLKCAGGAGFAACFLWADREE